MTYLRAVREFRWSPGSWILRSLYDLPRGGARISVISRILDSTWDLVRPIFCCMVLARAHSSPFPKKKHETSLKRLFVFCSSMTFSHCLQAKHTVFVYFIEDFIHKNYQKNTRGKLKGVGPSTNLAWHGLKQLDISVKVDRHVETSRFQKGCVKWVLLYYGTLVLNSWVMGYSYPHPVPYPTVYLEVSFFEVRILSKSLTSVQFSLSAVTRGIYLGGLAM